MSKSAGTRKKKPFKPASSMASASEVISSELNDAEAVATPFVYAMVALLLVSGAVSYWPTIQGLIKTWQNVPDYSHGFLIVPTAVFMLWSRRDTMPALGKPSWAGVVASLAFCGLLRWAGARYFFGFLDHWSIMFFALAATFALGGWRLVKWALPAIAFLFFMFPLPFAIEGLLSSPLQRIATKISVWCLQLLGQPCYSAGNIIYVGDNTLEVAQACSGLRLFLSIVAVGYVYLVLTDGPLWEKVLLAVATLPIAIVANSVRIIGTGLLYQSTTDEGMRHLAHDAAGWLMMPLAALLFWIWFVYLRKLFPEDDEVSLSTIVKRASV
jgi:exosortase